MDEKVCKVFLCMVYAQAQAHIHETESIHDPLSSRKSG